MTTGTNVQLPTTDNGSMIEANGVDLYVETFGDEADPAILLIHGAATSMYGWQVEFCQRLADGGRYVIRFDQRDTGQSVSYPPGRPDYSFADLSRDVLGILDALAIEQAHLVGISMGGGIAMGAALMAPDRVASLTLMSSSPGGPGLPPMSEEFIAFVSEQEPPDWSDREAAVEHMLAFLEICMAPQEQLDRAWWREALGLDLDRTVNVESSQINHFSLKPDPGMPERRDEIGAPTLVIHGDQDPVFPLGHGEALAQRIPGARLLVLEDAGHLMLEPTWDRIVPAILEHTEGGA